MDTASVPLPGWREGATRQAILDYVAAADDPGHAGFVPVRDRVAAFDNDGTLWVEQPLPPQGPFLLGKLVERVRLDPTLAQREPYRSIVAGDPEFFSAMARQEPWAIERFLAGIGEAWEGCTPEEYEADVLAFVDTHRDDRFGRRCTELVYQPMLELFDLLSAHEWRVFVCSGGGRDFMRVIAEETWGILQENVIGSSPEWTYRDGQLRRENAMRGELALGPGKPSHIFARTGRLPRFASGNGDVDIEMLEVAALRLVIVHDDPDREYAYTAGAERLLARGREHGWAMASIKDDWSTVFVEGEES